MSMPSYHTRLSLCLAHITAHVRNGSMIHAQTLYMLEAYLAATFQGWTDSFVLGVILPCRLLSPLAWWSKWWRRGRYTTVTIWTMYWQHMG